MFNSPPLGESVMEKRLLNFWFCKHSLSSLDVLFEGCKKSALKCDEIVLCKS